MGTPIIVVEPVVPQALYFSEGCAIFQLAGEGERRIAFPIDAVELVGESS